jgi:hypothetical protein
VYLWRRALFATALAVVAGGAVACSGSKDPAALTATPSASPTVVAVETVASDAPAAAVPGGAVVLTSPGSPAACGTLANAAVLRTLATTFGQFAAEQSAGTGSAGPATDRLRHDAAQLRGLAAQVDLPAVPARLITVADAIDTLAGAQTTDKDAIAPLGDAFARLGEAVQGQCHFSIG